MDQIVIRRFLFFRKDHLKKHHFIVYKYYTFSLHFIIKILNIHYYE